MSDLVGRLRHKAMACRTHGRPKKIAAHDADVFEEAAAEIERLTRMLNAGIEMDKENCARATAAEAEVERWRAFQGPADEAACELTINLAMAGYGSDWKFVPDGEEGTAKDFSLVWDNITSTVKEIISEKTAAEAERDALREALEDYACGCER